MDVKLPDGSNAEMQYKVITEGSGPTPQSNDVVQVNYRGTLIDGKEFDSSAKHGGPQKFPANRVVRGWSEALQHMKVGSKWELFIPSSLAYGDVGNPNIEPGSTLLFEVELVGIEPPQAPPTSQPLTSDIIKVPSAEELKKGAKIEVIKPEDAARMANQAHTNAPAKK
jgi:FKBP-type peptidyl-prolyl cis-trans isomerase 2